MYGNNLNGPLPIELGELTSLHNLDLSENQFTGTIPTELNKLTKLTTFALHQTDGDLHGKLPAFDGLPHISELSLESNHFTGTIPSNFLGGILDKTAMIEASLGFNQLTGDIPSSLVGFDRMVLNLEGNKITGYAGHCMKPKLLGFHASKNCLF